jgi:hypothetical protein
VQPPFYAVRLYAGDIGTFVGLAVDADARVLGTSRAPPGGSTPQRASPSARQ